jgi:dihydrofolate synthase/folylpolyglutamate synthase
MMPRDARYYFTQASIKRALPAGQMQRKATEFGLQGGAYASVGEALRAAREEASSDDFLFIGGSCFIVADLLLLLHQCEN